MQQTIIWIFLIVCIYCSRVLRGIKYPFSFRIQSLFFFPLFELCVLIFHQCVTFNVNFFMFEVSLKSYSWVKIKNWQSLFPLSSHKRKLSFEELLNVRSVFYFLNSEMEVANHFPCLLVKLMNSFFTKINCLSD